MKPQLGLALLLSLVSAASAYAAGADRADRLDISRSRSEARYGTVGNQPQTETIVTPPTTRTITVPDDSGTRMKGFAEGKAKTKKKVVVVPGTVRTVTRPAPARINPY